MSEELNEFYELIDAIIERAAEEGYSEFEAWSQELMTMRNDLADKYREALERTPI